MGRGGSANFANMLSRNDCVNRRERESFVRF